MLGLEVFLDVILSEFISINLYAFLLFTIENTILEDI